MTFLFEAVNNTMNSFFEDFFSEVQDQPQTFVRQAEIGQQHLFVNSGNGFD